MTVPSLAIRRTWPGFFSAHSPVTPKVAVTPSRWSSSRISEAKPVSAPASKVIRTVRLAVGPRVTRVAGPVRGPPVEPRLAGLAPGPGPVGAGGRGEPGVAGDTRACGLARHAAATTITARRTMAADRAGEAVR